MVPVSSLNIFDNTNNSMNCQMVNHTHNALEQYNKCSTKFIHMDENESCVQAEVLRQVCTNRWQEVERDNPTIPNINHAHYTFQDNMAAAWKIGNSLFNMIFNIYFSSIVSVSTFPEQLYWGFYLVLDPDNFVIIH